jgi:hypothetical protein
MWVDIRSRWLGRKDGELVVYHVWYYYQQGRLDAWHITHYDVECEETHEIKEVPYAIMQQQIAKKRLINIGDYTKEQWIELSKQQTP